MGLSRLVLLTGLCIVMGFLYWSRWQRASAMSDAMGQESATLRRVSLELFHHPAWHQLWRGIAAQQIRVVDGATGPGEFRVAHLRMFSASGYCFSSQDPQAYSLTAFLTGPRKLVASLDLRSGQVLVREPAFGEWVPEAG